MARTTTYLNFPRTTEEAFVFYKKVFKTEYVDEISRMGEAPDYDGNPIPDKDKNLVMHVALPILGGHILMGTDLPDSMASKLVVGNNVSINLEPDSPGEADILFKALSEGGTVTMPMQKMFWGAYFGTLTDRFGINWMVNCEK